jgi:NAD(P)-dependent dehydrogenase (short-subunit alcohol dehydrogenase family)
MRWSDMNFEVVNKNLPAAEQPLYPFMKRWGYADLEEVAYAGIDGYNRSKVANVLAAIGFTQALYEKYGILSVAVHPGVIQTELSRDFAAAQLERIDEMVANGTIVYKTLGAGASTSLVAALDDKVTVEEKGGPQNRENYGAFMTDCQVNDKATDLSTSSSEAARLWTVSEDLVQETFSW